VIDALAGAGDGLPCPAGTPAVPACGYPDLGVHDRSHLFFVEPDHLREQTDLPTAPPMPFSSSGNLVLAIHAYTHVFTLDALAGESPSRASYPPGGYDLSYTTGQVEAAALGAALFVDEFGSEPGADATVLASQLREQERHLVGSTFWTWKESCALGATWGVYDGVFAGRADGRCAYDRPPGARDTAPEAQSGCLRQDRARLLVRPWPRALAGSSTRVGYRYDPADGHLRMSAVAPGGAAETLLFVPAAVRGAVAVDGRAAIGATDVGADGSRLVHVRPAGGAYGVTVQPAPVALPPC